MIIDRITKALRSTEDSADTLIYRMAEQILCDALKLGARSINVRCHPKEKNPLADALAIETAQDSLDERRCLNGRGDYELGFFISSSQEDVPYLTVPVVYFLPLLNILSSEKTAHKEKQCFAIYRESSSRRVIDKYLDVTLYLEKDFSITIAMTEIA